MKIHRVRLVKSIDDLPNDHIMIEVENDRWIEFDCIPSHDGIHEFLKCEIDQKRKYLGFNSRSFDIGIIKNWEEVIPICQK